LTDISEYGDVMINAYLDEWGRRKIDGLLEDGTRILIAAALIIKTWTALLNTSHVFARPYRLFKLSQALQTLASWTLPIPAALKRWLATLQTSHVFTRPFRRIGYTQQLQPTHVFRRPVRVIRFPAPLQLTHLFNRPTRFMRLIERLTLGHAYFVTIPGVKKTKLFLLIGDLAIQISGD